ncbi:MAG: rod shape-determining protein [Parcubacteria group bacterium CG10_big_fil_rev_8_21_14_0_10_36_14]|nr:MAG: rod shape-determining protein [Parcubacteria group bacterium CG10_big_fil_rev_8_21_14_0_10_36_14]
MIKNFLGRFSKDLGIDLGTSNTVIYVKDRGIVINEPSIVAINKKTNQVLAVGREAREMVGKTPPHIETCKPLLKGIISDFEVTEKMLRFFINKVHEGGFNIMPRPRVVVGVPLEITEVERKAVEDATLSAGAREVFLVEEPMAAAIGARLPIEEADGNLIVDIGGGTTQIAVISLSGIVTWKAITIAGDELNKNIIQYAKDVFNLLLGEKHAENIKHSIASAYRLNERQQIEMRGRDLASGLPKEIIITDDHIREAVSRSIKKIVENIKSTLEETPPELVADIYERGLVLCGGGALLQGLDKLIADFTAIPVRIADDPLTCVARGTGALLSNPTLLKEVALDAEYTL